MNTCEKCGCEKDYEVVKPQYNDESIETELICFDCELLPLL